MSQTKTRPAVLAGQQAGDVINVKRNLRHLA